MSEKPISSALAALFFAICVIVILTVPTWGRWVDEAWLTEQEIADRHLRAYVQARGCQ